MDWGIISWPILNVTEAGNTRWAKETASKRKNQSLGPQEKVTGRSKRIQRKAVVSSPGVANAGRTKKSRELFAGVVITTPRPQTDASIPASASDPAPTSDFVPAFDPTPASDSAPAADPDLAPGPAPAPAPAPSPAPASSPGPSSVPIAFNGGMIHSILLQDTSTFEGVLNNPSSSRTNLKLKAAELRAISFREKTDVEGLTRYINKRAKILDKLADKLSDAGSTEEGDDMDDEEEDDEEDEEEDEEDDKEDEEEDDEEEEEEDDEEEEENGGEQMVEDGDAEQDADTGEEQTKGVGGK